jgi:hypothetical protein
MGLALVVATLPYVFLCSKQREDSIRTQSPPRRESDRQKRGPGPIAEPE